jgi:predicted ATP-dependent endonuclease of OLD family
MKIYVNIGDFLEGEFELKDLNILAGHPESGKTLLLNIIHYALQKDENALVKITDSLKEKIVLLKINNDIIDVECRGGKYNIETPETLCYVKNMTDAKSFIIPHNMNKYAKLKALESLRDKILFLLLEDPDASLHPKVMKRLALLLHKIAANNIVIIETHNLTFIDMLRNIDKIARELNEEIEPTEISLVVTRKAGKRFKIENIDPASSYIESYVDEILTIYE